MANFLKFNQPVKVKSLASDPSSPEAGLLYYNTTSNDFRFYDSNAAAFVSLSKALADHPSSTSNPHSVSKSQVLSGDLIVNADVDGSAAIAYSKLNLSASIVNADIDAAAAIAESKLNLDYSTSTLNTAISDHISDATDAHDASAISAVDNFTNSDSTDVQSVLEDLDSAISSGSGDVTGPGSSTDNAIARFDSTTGKIIQNSGVVVDDSNNITGVNDLTVDGNLQVDGTTTTVNTATLDVEDANITVNNGGNQATANSNIAGFTVEMSDATDAVFGYDSSLTSKFKLGESGSEVEVADVSSSQTLTNKTMDADSNTISNIANDEIKAAAAIAVDKLAALTTDRALVSDGSGFMSASSVTATELGYVSGVTSAIQTQLDSKLENVSEDSSPSLGGDLDVDSNVIYDSSALKFGSSDSDFYEEEYVNSQTLTDNTSAVASAFTYAAASFEGCIIDYKIKETSEVRVGKLMIANEANTNVSVVDTFAESSTDLGVEWSVAFNGANVELSYTCSSTGNDRTMRAIVRRIKA